MKDLPKVLWPGPGGAGLLLAVCGLSLVVARGLLLSLVSLAAERGL